MEKKNNLITNFNSTEEYKKALIKAELYFPAPSKGSFILPPKGYSLWKNIQKNLEKKLLKHEIKNVLLPTFIPLSLFIKEQQHIEGFEPEFFLIEKKNSKKDEKNRIVLRPTSEVLFYDWYRQILQSYQQLPFIHNQWCSAFRAEKNTSPFLRNTEFFWQEGHSIHATEDEAQQFITSVEKSYQSFIKKTLNLATISGKKSQKEKFSGALFSYTIECLLPDGQCLQLATFHYFGNNFCQSLGVKFFNDKNQIQHPFSTSWGTSTRLIGAITKTHQDKWGIVLPFEVSPIQFAFILINNDKKLIEHYKKIRSFLDSRYRCQLYCQSSQTSSNLTQSDKEGVPLKIIIGQEEVINNSLTLIRRGDLDKFKIILKDKRSFLKIIKKEIELSKKALYQKNKLFLREKIFIIKKKDFFLEKKSLL